uniref:Uncharacterized protein n=1 Tax=Meloidogyne enterolobii TaxID=390850 RepID=A0A6V7X2A5_MELEN|nr:unnamed protein product [Meloidogyne enterolobii]
MLSSSPANSLGEGKKVKQTNNFNQINNYSNNNFNITQKRHLEVNNEMFGEEPVDKMPKLELMTELDKRATEETLKFISELVNQQQKQTESPQPCSSSSDWQNNNLIYSQNVKGNELSIKNESINSCPISSPIGINFNNNFDYNQNSMLAFNKKVEPFEGSGLSFNGYMSGLLEGNSIQNGSVHSDLKIKCLLDNNSNKKRSDYLNWEEFLWVQQY